VKELEYFKREFLSSPDWPRGLPLDEAAFVFEMRFTAGDLELIRSQRTQLRRVARACRRAGRSIDELMQAGVANNTILGLMAALANLHLDLEAAVDRCERAARGRRGRPCDEAMHFLIRCKHRQFQSANPGQLGYWRDNVTGEYRGRFLEHMEATLERLGYPCQSREALGVAIGRALSTPL
jgi:hypothetical protein